MKKILSILLTATMLLGMASFGVFADEAPDYTSIDSVEEYVEFAKAVDAGTYTNGADHKVNVDLDFTGYNAEDVVISNQVRDLQLNFQGHTVSGLVREVTLTDHGNVGMLIDNAPNYVEILNVKIKDCKLVVNCPLNDKGYAPWAMVGGVIGKADRAYVNNVDFENVTIELNGPGAVGLAYGEKLWNDYRGPDIAISTKNVVVNATSTDAKVGLVIGRMGEVNDDTISITKLDITNTTINSSNEVTATTYDGDAKVTHVSLKEGVTANFALVDNAVGYCDHGETEVKNAVDETCTEKGYSGDTYCKACGIKLADGEEIDAKGHGETEVQGKVDATETEKGYTGDKVCKDCGETVEEGEEIPALGSGDEGDVTPPPTGDVTPPPTGDVTPPPTGDVMIVLSVVAVIALAGALIVSKKRSVC